MSTYEIVLTSGRLNIRSLIAEPNSWKYSQNPISGVHLNVDHFLDFPQLYEESDPNTDLNYGIRVVV